MTMGVLYAITAEDREELLDAGDAEEVLTYCVETIEEDPRWEGSPLRADTDKAWDAVHRCLAGGQLVVGRHLFPLDHAILGGQVLAEDDGLEPSQQGLEYTVANFRDVRAFYRAAAQSGRAVIFTAF